MDHIQGRDLAGKVALIAGGGGIGAAVARRLAAEGCRVVLGDKDGDGAERDAGAIRADGGECMAVAYDQSDEASVAALVQKTVDGVGAPDFAFVNAMDMAAVEYDTDLLDIDMGVFDQTLAVGLRGSVLVARAVMPYLAARRGAIVFTSSDAAHFGEPCRFAYAMTKSAVNALMRHIASRWGPQGVRANAILPGIVMIPRMAEKMDEAIQSRLVAGSRSTRLGRGEDIAAMVAMLFSKDGEWVNGQTISVNGGGTMRP
ncbi:NAD(P)-dependent dehydrogenase (short-subunit alcohol dehydrogenase family) [Sphingobium sp. OAS761]|nr:NAD(P)-dependent dehydrogenase (short-subunit alcohol dehydrogenase family) [Sphingobium sp. OAS761]